MEDLVGSVLYVIIVACAAFAGTVSWLCLLTKGGENYGLVKQAGAELVARLIGCSFFILMIVLYFVCQKVETRMLLVLTSLIYSMSWVPLRFSRHLRASIDTAARVAEE
ncbi:MAG: hypothetical protein P4L53_04020 [Candidatus Obscuribacterales bacterium]|nr:hypothetical protein [Candidatus Obscuribacterales bacterium]